MNQSVFFYVEFECFTDAGHRVHTANHYADKLRTRAAFNHYRVIAPQAKLTVNDLYKALSGYDVVDLSLDEMLTPATERTNIVEVGLSLCRSLKSTESIPWDTGVVYSHMPSPFALLALYIGVRALIDDTGKRPRVLIRLCMIDEEWTWYQLRLSRLIVLIQSDPIVGEQFCFTTESRRLSSYYKERCGNDFPVQFNPFRDIELVITRNKHKHHYALYGNRVYFAYLGEAREEKGFQFLPQLVKALRSSGIQFSFLVHAFSNGVNDTEIICEAREELYKLAAGHSDIHLVRVPVPDSIYLAHQRRADIVVMPYQHKAYNIRGSGVAFEAIRSNSFILASKDLDFGITFKDSGRVVEYQPDDVDVIQVNEIVSKLYEARKYGMNIWHPAERYRESFFEQTVAVLQAEKFQRQKECHTDYYASLMRVLKLNSPISLMSQKLSEIGIVLIN